MKEKENKEKLEKPWKSKAQKAIFTLLAAGFTLISAWNGLTFYKVLFGMSMAILISATFEIARFACLFRSMNKSKGIGVLTILTYIIVASVCAFASINSFTYEVIKRDRASQGQYRQQIQQIKQTYSKKIEEQMTTLDKDVAYIEKMVAKYPNSGYWKRRLERSVENRGKLVTRRDTFLATHPENPGQWVTAKSAMLDLKLEKPSSESEDMISVTQALKELWGLDKATAQKIMGIVVTLTVELSIILLSFLSHVTRPKEKPQSVAGVAENHGSVAKKATAKKIQTTHGIDALTKAKFVAANKQHFEQTGELLPMRKLAKSLRPVRKIFETFDKESLEKLFEK